MMQEENKLTDEEKDKVIHSLLRDVHELRREVNNIKNDAIIENLKLPVDVLQDIGVISDKIPKIRRGNGNRPILESEILEAQSKFSTAIDCAKYLETSYATYKKWAKKYGIFKTNPWGIGDKKKYWEPNKGKYPLNQLIEGKFPDYPIFRLKDLLIRSNTKNAECENCGFNERRITDNKIPLILNFEDGNEKNHILSNIKLLCYNCTFLCGKGYIRRGKVFFNDPDIIQGSRKNVKARF